MEETAGRARRPSVLQVRHRVQGCLTCSRLWLSGSVLTNFSRAGGCSCCTRRAWPAAPVDVPTGDLAV